MASKNLVEYSRRWFNSLSVRKLQRYANANEGKHTRKLRRVLRCLESEPEPIVLLKDPDTGIWKKA